MDKPFRGMRISRAIEKILLDEQAKSSKPASMSQSELLELLIVGGSAVGESSDPQANISRAIVQGKNNGYLLVLEDGYVALGPIPLRLDKK